MRWWNGEPTARAFNNWTLATNNYPTHTNMILSIGYGWMDDSFGYGLQMAEDESLFFPLCQKTGNRRRQVKIGSYE